MTSDPRDFTFLAFLNLCWLRDQRKPAERWSAEIQEGGTSGRKLNYRIRGLVRTSDTTMPVTIRPVNEEGAPEWTCRRCNEDLQGLLPCRHVAAIAALWLLKFKESRPSIYKMCEDRAGGSSSPD